MMLQQWVFAGATAALLLALALGLPFPDRRTLRHPALLGAAALFLVSLIVQAIAVEPTLIHADVAAPELVDCVLQFPARCTGRGGSYGQYGFWLLGGVSTLLGGDLSGLFRAMQIFGALNVALLAILAYRFSGSPYGALLAVAVTGTNPIFMRVAGSEDMHNVGLFLGLLAFLAMDVFAVTRRSLPLVAAVLALGLMIHTRQTFYVFAPCAFLLCLARGGSDLLKCRRFWLAGLSVLGILVMRVLQSNTDSLTGQMVRILSEPVLVPTMLRNHGLLDATRFGPLPLLTIAAVLWGCLAGNVARAVVVTFLINFLVTYPCGMPSPGVELAQRLSVFAIGMLLVAMAGAAAVEKWLPGERRAATGLILATLLFSVPPLFPGWRSLTGLTPIHQEYRAVEAAAASLPQRLTLVMIRPVDSASYGGARYAGLLRRLGKTVDTVWADEADGRNGRRFFLENLECWTYSFYELIGIEKGRAEQKPGFEFRWDYVLFGRRPSPVRPPAEARPQCQPFLRNGVPIGRKSLIIDPADDPPFLFYATDEVPVQFRELRTG